MPRIARKYLDTSFFHVMVQGINKEYIFKNERYISRYIQLIRKNLHNEHIRIISFCIMNNHAHLLIKTEDIKELSKYMQKVNCSYAKYYNYVENERVGYVFRDRYKSEPILNRRQLLQCIKYIHKNPVKAGMVASEEKYKYSSYCFYQQKLDKNIKDEVLTMDEIELICDSNIEYEEDFLDIDNNIEKIIDNAISKFVYIEKIKVFEIFEKSDILKKLIKYLKIDRKIKYTDIMKRLDITKGIMERLKK